MMKVLIGVKRVVDYNVNVRVKSDFSGVETSNIKMSINPFDEVAVQQAVSMKEAGVISEIVVVSVGPEKCSETLRTALAMGADRAVWVSTDLEIEPLGVAKALRALVDKEAPSLVLLGKQAIDDDCNQTAQMLAGLLSWAQGVAVSRMELEGEVLRVSREVDLGTQELALRLPAVVSVDLRLNEPRHVSLPNIMKAKKKPFDTVSPESLGVDLAPRLITLKVFPPQARSAGRMVTGVADLAAELTCIEES